MVAGKRRVELQGEITSAGAQLAKFFLLNQSSRDRVHGAGIYSIIREEGNEGKITQSGNFLPRFERYNERGKRVLMDSLGYTFFIPDVHTPLLPSPPFWPLFAINWKFNCLPIFPQEEKRKRGIPLEYSWFCNSKWPILRWRICCFYSKWLNFVPREPPRTSSNANEEKEGGEGGKKRRKKKEKLLSSPVE